MAQNHSQELNTRHRFLSLHQLCSLYRNSFRCVNRNAGYWGNKLLLLLWIQNPVFSPFSCWNWSIIWFSVSGCWLLQTRTVQVKQLSDLAGEREIHEFFSFSGEIEHVEILRWVVFVPIFVCLFLVAWIGFLLVVILPTVIEGCSERKKKGGKGWKNQRRNHGVLLVLIF